jgi:rhodanese-related sulfurtransferase
VGSLQALEAIKVLVSDPPPYDEDSLQPLLGRLWIIRAATMETQRLRIQRNEECAVCSKPSAAITLSETEAASCFKLQEFQAQELLGEERWQDYQWVDVRETDEWARGHVPGAWHWPLSKLQSEDCPKLPSASRPLLLYCQGGMRSKRAFELLSARGGLDLSGHLKDGFQGWRGPVE